MKQLLPLAALLLATTAQADPAEIVQTQARASGASYTFSVTLKHADTGWDDYADGWRVLAPDGTVLGTRILYHPHVNEQPFTRSHTIEIPAGMTEVLIESSTNTTGWSGARATFQLPSS